LSRAVCRRARGELRVYTYTVGRNGGAVADVLRREIPELVKDREANDTEAIGQHVWWALITAGEAEQPCSRSQRSISRCGI
jgi:hypothetical protein